MAAVGVAAGLVTVAYTGVLLQGLASVLFWQTMLLPALFALSSLSCGVACAFLGAAFVETRRPITRPLARLALVDGVLVVLEALVLAGYLAWAFTGEGTASAAQALVAGDLRWVFWGGAVLCGLAVPFALERYLTPVSYTHLPSPPRFLLPSSAARGSPSPSRWLRSSPLGAWPCGCSSSPAAW